MGIDYSLSGRRVEKDRLETTEEKENKINKRASVESNPDCTADGSIQTKIRRMSR